MELFNTFCVSVCARACIYKKLFSSFLIKCVSKLEQKIKLVLNSGKHGTKLVQVGPELSCERI